MARPTKHPDEKRSERVYLRFTLAEITGIRIDAAAKGLTTADFLHQKCLTGKAIPHNYSRGVPPEEIAAINNLGLELSRLGNLANQIARNVNSGRRVPDGEGWEQLPSMIAHAQECVTAALRQRLTGDDQ